MRPLHVRLATGTGLYFFLFSLSFRTFPRSVPANTRLASAVKSTRVTMSCPTDVEHSAAPSGTLHTRTCGRGPQRQTRQAVRAGRGEQTNAQCGGLAVASRSTLQRAALRLGGAASAESARPGRGLPWQAGTPGNRFGRTLPTAPLPVNAPTGLVHDCLNEYLEQLPPRTLPSAQPVTMRAGSVGWKAAEVTMSGCTKERRHSPWGTRAAATAAALAPAGPGVLFPDVAPLAGLLPGGAAVAAAAVAGPGRDESATLAAGQVLVPAPPPPAVPAPPAEATASACGEPPTLPEGSARCCASAGSAAPLPTVLPPAAAPAPGPAPPPPPSPLPGDPSLPFAWPALAGLASSEGRSTNHSRAVWSADAVSIRRQRDHATSRTSPP